MNSDIATNLPNNKLADQEKWRKSKKRNFWIIVTCIFLIVMAFFAYIFFYNKPTCFDGLKNGIEAGVDCGGTCEIMCKETQIPISSSWVKIFDVGGDRYFYAADLSNRNLNSEIKYIKYSFKIYNGTSLLQEIEGSTSFAPSQRKIISGQFYNKVKPTSATIEFDENYFFSKSLAVSTLKLSEGNYSKSQNDALDKISFEIINGDIIPYNNLIANIIVYSSDGSPIAYSKTVIDEILPLSNKNIFYTWPKGTLDNMQTYQVIYQKND